MSLEKNEYPNAWGDDGHVFTLASNWAKQSPPWTWITELNNTQFYTFFLMRPLSLGFC